VSDGKPTLADSSGFWNNNNLSAAAYDTAPPPWHLADENKSCLPAEKWGCRPRSSHRCADAWIARWPRHNIFITGRLFCARLVGGLQQISTEKKKRYSEILLRWDGQPS
jgi:hypothetical protein